MAFEQFARTFLPEIEENLRQAVDRLDAPETEELRHMLAYHMGWEGEGAGSETQGKRIRPLIVLLAAAAAGGEPHSALPAAAAVELIHNFSLIHDDIEDNSPLRHGRPTVWSRWGVAQAINAGDALFTLAHLVLLDLEQSVSSLAALQAARLLQESCLHLTQGQFLDLAYENRPDLSVEDYWPMVSGKTAALLAACAGLGALAAEADLPTRDAYYRFGWSLGLAFQAQDDLLGIWGDAALTGKSAESDLVSGKKSLPVLIALGKTGAFARRWLLGPVKPEEVQDLASLMEEDGARAATLEHADRLTAEALGALEEAHPQGQAGEALRELALRLLKRRV